MKKGGQFRAILSIEYSLVQNLADQPPAIGGLVAPEVRRQAAMRMLLIAGETVQTVAENVHRSFDLVQQTFVRRVEVDAQHAGRELTGRVSADVRADDRLAHDPYVVSIGQVQFGRLFQNDLRVVLGAVE